MSGLSLVQSKHELERTFAAIRVGAYEIPPDEALAAKETRAAFNALLDRLTYREAEIVRMHSGLENAEYTLKEIGRYFRITRERVRQIEAKAIRKLQQILTQRAGGPATAGALPVPALEVPRG